MRPRIDAAASMRRLRMVMRRCGLAALKVYEYLTELERHHPQVSPSRARIAAQTGYCTRQVSRAVAELEAAGALKVWRDPPHKCEDGTFRRARTNLYRLTWPPKTAKPLVAPRRHLVHAIAACRAVVPAGAAGGPGATPPNDPPPALFTPDPPAEPPDDGPAAPPWLLEGITPAEWLARQRVKP